MWFKCQKQILRFKHKRSILKLIPVLNGKIILGYGLVNIKSIKKKKTMEVQYYYDKLHELHVKASDQRPNLTVIC